MSIFAQAKRRGVFRIAATYLVVSWLVLEVGYVLSTILGLPKPVMKTLLALLVLGFPLLIALAWNFRLTGDGWFRHPELPETEPAADHEHALHEGDDAHGGHGHGGAVGGVDPLPFIVGIMVLGGLVVLGVNKLMGGDYGSAKLDDHGEPVIAAAATSASPVTTAAPARVAAPNSIAVLPFENLSAEASQSYFSDGMTEELRSALAGVAGLQVAARTSSNAFRQTTSDAGTIAAKLGVAYTLEGSVRRAGDVVRVSAQLIEAKSGFERWSQTYERKVNDVFAIQSEIAANVADQLKVRLLPQEAARLTEGATQSIAAHDSFLRGRQLYRQSGDESVYRDALAQFDAAIAADPAYAAAHAARASALAFIAAQFADTAAEAKSLNAEALVSARKAVQLAPYVAYVQSTLGYVLERSTFDITGAKAAYQRSMIAGSGDADLLNRYGLFNARVGDQPRGIAALEKAVVLDPLNAVVAKGLGSALFFAGRYDEAAARQRQALRINPDVTNVRFELGSSLLMLGKTDAAFAEFNAEPTRWAKLTGLAIAEKRRGNPAAAQAAFKALVADYPDTTLYQQAQVLAQWGDKPGALAALDRALAAMDGGLLYLRRDPLLEPLRAEPRFKALEARLTPA
nr:tetratricopeptide repeat protein [Polymorphobacter sp.]